MCAIFPCRVANFAVRASQEWSRLRLPCIADDWQFHYSHSSWSPPLPLATPFSGILCQRVSELLLLITSTFICGNRRFVQTYFPLDRCHQTAYSQFKGNTWRTHTHTNINSKYSHTQSWTQAAENGPCQWAIYFYIHMKIAIVNR